LAQAPVGGRGPLLILSVIDVKPDMMAEFGELQAQTMKAQRKGGQAWRETWNVQQLGRPYRVGVLRPLTSYAELDGQSFTIKGAGAEGARVINERARRMIVAQQIMALQSRPDLGYGTRPVQSDLALLTTVTTAAGRGADFETLLKTDVVPGLKKAAFPYLGVSQVVYGGDPSQYLTLIEFKDFATLDQGHPFYRALGPDGVAKFNQKLVGVVTHFEREIIRYNPALSFRTAPAPAP
jgi:hypothetical protein